jgi:hypothetical protein
MVPGGGREGRRGRRQEREAIGASLAGQAGGAEPAKKTLRDDEVLAVWGRRRVAKTDAIGYS